MLSVADDRISTKTTFVSAYYDLCETPYFSKHPEHWNYEHIFYLVKLRIPFCLYISPNCAHLTELQELETEYASTFRIMAYRPVYTDFLAYRIYGENTKLPEERNQEKDTIEYLTYMHGRLELLEDAISENIWNTEQFAWIDFNVFQLFKNAESAGNTLRELSHFTLPVQDKIYIPGCWSKMQNTYTVPSQIHWRFCGAFFIGGIKATINFIELYRTHLPGLMLELDGVLPWEVNLWAWLEWRNSWSPIWYRGDHNDSLIHVISSAISADAYAVKLPSYYCGEYEHPQLTNYWPGSASYIHYNGRDILNIRYVNYWVYPSGYYRFQGGNTIIETRNMCSILDSHTLLPIEHCEMDAKLYDASGIVMEPSTYGNGTPPPSSKGLEDIRLFIGANNELRFIATNMDYSATNRNRMMVGTYDIATMTCRDCVSVIPPDPNSWCEKNWTPVKTNASDYNKLGELFIYKWYPMEIGHICSETGQLKIDIVHNDGLPWIYSKLRGSTTFIDVCSPHYLPIELRGENSMQNSQYLIGLTHFSEEHSPRHYYHTLILLDKQTLRPVANSQVFYFNQLGIEFCIGMCMRECGCPFGDKSLDPFYVFWVSRFDRDPICIWALASNIKWNVYLHK